MTYQKTIDRITIQRAGHGISDWTTIHQTHRNGSDCVVGEIILDDLAEVKDLHYALGCLIEKSKPKETDQ